MATSANVTAGKPKTTGAIFVGATNLTMPTNATTALQTGFTEVGYASEDGLTNANSRTVENIKAWGGDTVLTTQTEKTDTFSFTLLEAANVDVLKIIHGDGNVSGTLADGIAVEVNAEELPYKAWVFEMIYKGAVKRVVVPRAKVTEIGDVAYTDSDAVAYPITITAEPDADGNTHYEYIKASA